MVLNNQNKTEESRSVFVAIIGRPNVGKSSLLNYLVGEKAAIVTPKPQTTRTRITGIRTDGAVQYVFIDTPGIHHPRTALGKKMEKSAKDSVEEGDVVLMLFDPQAPLRPVETEMVHALQQGKSRVVAAVNKADTIQEGDILLKKVAELESFKVFDKVLPISAATGEGCDVLLKTLEWYAAPGPHFFADDLYTDQPEKQLAAELIREKLLLHLKDEIPHGTAVEIDRFHERDESAVIDIDAVIYCEKKSHKGMIIGKGGSMLKKIASDARREIEQLLDIRVNLQCWVKVRDGWRDNEHLLGYMGFGRE